MSVLNEKAKIHAMHDSIIRWAILIIKVDGESSEYLRRTSMTVLHGLVFSNDYGVQFFKKFTLVLNALDNRGK